MLLVIANSFVNSGEDTLEFNPVAAAAERTQSSPGAKFTMKVTYTSAALPQPMHAHGYGAYNSETGRSRAVLVLPSSPRGRGSVETVADGTSFYLRGSGAMADGVPDGKEWVKIQPFLGQSEEDVMLSGSGSSPDDSLQMLRAVSGDVQKVGQERVRGIPTERYRATATMSDYAELMREEGNDEIADLYEKYAALSPSPILTEASIDTKGIVRRSRMVMALPSEEDQSPVTMDMRMELFAFGARPEIELPDPSQVFDATPLLEEELDSAGTD
jgi:hypothetical protein